MFSQTGIQEIRETIKRAVDNQEIPGANLLILKDGNEQLYCEEGYANLEEKKKIQRDTIFRLYSMERMMNALNNRFVQINRSNIVNIEYVRSVRGFELQLKDCDKMLKISRRRKNVIMDALFQMTEKL